MDLDYSECEQKSNGNYGENQKVRDMFVIESDMVLWYEGDGYNCV